MPVKIQQIAIWANASIFLCLKMRTTPINPHKGCTSVGKVGNETNGKNASIQKILTSDIMNLGCFPLRGVNPEA